MSLPPDEHADDAPDERVPDDMAPDPVPDDPVPDEPVPDPLPDEPVSDEPVPEDTYETSSSLDEHSEPAGGSKLFPQLPDDPRMVEAERARSQVAADEGTQVMGVTDAEEPAYDAPPTVDPAAWAASGTDTPRWQEGSHDYVESSQVADERAVLDDASGRGAGRNLPMAILAGAVLAGLFFVSLAIGTAVTVGYAAVVTVLAAAELFSVARTHGYRPATLLGLVAVASFSAAVYWRGTEAYPMMAALVVVVGLCWFVFGVEREHPCANFSITLTGVFWVGGLGSFAALLLREPGGDAVLIAVIIGTVAYDVLGYAVGRTTGQTRISVRISPNKTVEGLIAGITLSALITALVINRLPGIDPWSDDAVKSAILASAIALAAPLGDFAQSLFKRDFGVKDMGRLLPGHGGALDRFDAMLVALPAAYFTYTYALS